MKIQLIVFDIAGTTIEDKNELLACFTKTCAQEGITAPIERLNALMGVSKLEVFFQLWKEQLGSQVEIDLIRSKADHSYIRFQKEIENYYLHATIKPTEGALDVLKWARAKGIKIALNTGFYREVAEIILNKIGWLPVGPTSPIDFLVCSDEVPAGRPKPYMIHAIMNHFNISDPQTIVKVGDTPVDLLEGRNANCLLTLAVTNGTHSKTELSQLDHDGLMNSLSELPALLINRGLVEE